MSKNLYVFLFKIKYGLITTLICSIFLLIDLITKQITTNVYRSIIDGVISIYYTQNTGAAWSIFSNSTLFLIIITSFFIIFALFFNYFFNKKNILYSISFGLILSGATSNLIDRVFLGYVRDFIKLDFINFPIFIVADSVICIGVFLMIIFFLFSKNKEEK